MLKWFLILLSMICILIGFFYWAVIRGVAKEKNEIHSLLSAENVIDGMKYDFYVNEIHYPYYHYFFEKVTERGNEKTYFIKNLSKNTIENLDIFPDKSVVFYAKFSNKINKWIVLFYIDSIDMPMGFTEVKVYTFENKKKLFKSSFTAYSISENMKLDFEVDLDKGKIYYFNSKKVKQSLEIN